MHAKPAWYDDNDGGQGSSIVVKDSIGTELHDGDTVRVIQDLNPKGFEKLKQGRVFKNIRLTDDEEAIEVREGRTILVLKTCFLRKQD